MAQSDNIRNQRLQKLAELREQGVEPYANGFVPTHTIAQILGEFGALGAPELEALNQTFRLAGRLMLLREFGKASFCHFQDGTSRLQAYVQKQVLGPEAFALFKRLDLGDIVGVYRHAVSHQNRGAHPGGDRFCSPHQDRSCPCRKSSTASPTWRPATASATWT